MNTKVKPTTAWAISCHGAILPFTVRYRRKQCIQDYIGDSPKLSWSFWRRRGKRVHKVIIQPAPQP